jgi:GDP-L-fucose synthase
MTIDPSKKIFIAGHCGMVGMSLYKALIHRGYDRLVVSSKKDLDLTHVGMVNDFLEVERPDCIIIAAAKVGGIWDNQTHPAEFLHVNLAIAHNLIHGAFKYQVPRVLFLGSSCIYPREAPQPISEDALLTGPLEKTNEAYALAKIAGIKLCQFYRQSYGVLYHSAMPCNLYGPGDRYHMEYSHVIPALIQKFHRAKLKQSTSVTLWGSGRPRREFLYVEDLTEGLLRLLEENNPPDWVNIGSGEDVTIDQLAQTVKQVVGFEGDIQYDGSKPDGTLRKLLNSDWMRQKGWAPKMKLEQGLVYAYEDFLARHSKD